MNSRVKIDVIPRVTTNSRPEISATFNVQGWTILYLVEDNNRAKLYRAGIHELGGVGIAVVNAAALVERLQRSLPAWTIVMIDSGTSEMHETVALASRCQTLKPDIPVLILTNEVDLNWLRRAPNRVGVALRPRTIVELGKVIDKAQERAVLRSYVWPGAFTEEVNCDSLNPRIHEGWWLIPMILIGFGMWIWFMMILWQIFF